MTRIQFKRGSTLDWETANPVLLEGTPGYDTTTGAFKVGDGNTAWEDLGAVGGDAVAAAAEIAALTARITALETMLADYSRANDTKVQAVTNNMQGMFDIYAEQPGGSLRNFEDFYNGLKQFLSSAAGIDTAAILSAVEEILDVQLPARDQAIADLTEYLVTTVPTRDDVAAALQELMDAMNGPNATPAMIQQMFWTLDDLLMQVFSILDITVPDQGKAVP